MTQNVQELIDKIKQEGLEAGHEKAKQIETDANEKADAIVKQAQQEAEKIVAEAKAQQQQLEDSTRASLQQASRDTVLTLKQGISELLNKIIKQNIQEAMSKEQMVSLITEIARSYMSEQKEESTVQVGLNEESRKLLEKDITAKLAKEVKAGVTVRTADDLTGGFTISFDEGKSNFDFSEDALVQYLSQYVNEYVSNLLKG